MSNSTTDSPTSNMLLLNNRFYNDALNAACGDGLFGLFIMLVSAVISALFFTILVWCNSHTWIYFKHKAKYVKVGLLGIICMRSPEV